LPKATEGGLVKVIRREGSMEERLGGKKTHDQGLKKKSPAVHGNIAADLLSRHQCKKGAKLQKGQKDNEAPTSIKSRCDARKKNLKGSASECGVKGGFHQYPRIAERPSCG